MAQKDSVDSADYTYREELFLASDSGPFWCSAEAPNGAERSAGDALAFVEQFIGLFEDDVTVRRVVGHVRDTGDGLRFETDEDGDLAFWEIDA